MNPLTWLRGWLKSWLLLPPTPGPMYVFLGETNMGTAMRVTVGLPGLAPGEAGEVVQRRLTRVVNGGPAIAATFDASQPTFIFDAEQDDVVELSLVNIDDAGNISPPSERTVTIVDNIPPAAPGQMTVGVEEVPAEVEATTTTPEAT